MSQQFDDRERILRTRRYLRVDGLHLDKRVWTRVVSPCVYRAAPLQICDQQSRLSGPLVAVRGHNTPLKMGHRG